MLRLKAATMFVAVVLATNPLFGQSVVLGNGNTETVIDATAGGAFSTEPHDYTYFSFTTGSTVEITDTEATESTEWHIAFKRTEIKLNSGVSGPSEVKGFNMTSDTEIVPEDLFSTLSSSDVPSTDSFVKDEAAYAMKGWYSYDPVTHIISASKTPYIITTSDGSYGKIIIDNLQEPGRSNAGVVSLRWVMGNGTDLNGEEKTATIDLSSNNEAYFSLANETLVDVDDASNSDSWDLHFNGYTIKMNGGMSGSGKASAMPMEGEEFENIAVAPDHGYSSDQSGSIFGATYGGWYNYDGTTHLLSSKNHIYLIDTGNSVYKMQIKNYYGEVGGSPVSAIYTFQWRELNVTNTAISAQSWGQIKQHLTR